MVELLSGDSEGGAKVAVLCGGAVIHTPQDAMDLIGECYGLGAEAVVVDEKEVDPAFFDLKSGLAGEMLQKFTTYRVRLAIVGDFGRYESKSLRDFIRESNKGGRVVFVRTREEAAERLSK